MKKNFLVAVTFGVLLLSLAACNNDAANTSNYNYPDNIYDYAYTKYNQGSGYNYYRDGGLHTNSNNQNYTNADNVDRHYDFVSRLGFENVVNPNGYTYHERYQLNETSAVNNDIFHGWRHAWAEPNSFLNKDIDIYRYTGYYNGEPRTIHIKSYNGEVLGGYHFGEGETVENARMINYNGYSSRVSNDFRGIWNGLFGI